MVLSVLSLEKLIITKAIEMKKTITPNIIPSVPKLNLFFNLSSRISAFYKVIYLFFTFLTNNVITQTSAAIKNTEAVAMVIKVR